MKTLFTGLLLALLLPAAHAASTGGGAIQGTLFAPGGAPVTSNNVNFRIQILDKSGTCVLYEEYHLAQDLSSTNGDFSFDLGFGTSRTNKGVAGDLDASVFRNDQNIAAYTGCAGGVTVAPGDERLLKVEFDVGGFGTYTAMTPNLKLQGGAYSVVAETVQGKSPTDFVQIQNTGSAVVTQSNIANIFSTTNYPRLEALLAGTSSQYLMTSPSMPVDFNGQRLINVANGTAATDAVNRGYVDSTMGGNTLDDSGVSMATGDGRTLVWDMAGNRWTTGYAAPGGNAGGDLTGTYPNPTIRDNAITSVKVNTNFAVNRLLITDATTGANIGYASCDPDEVLKWTASGWACSTVSALSPVRMVAGKTPIAGDVPLNAADITGLGNAATRNYGTAAGQLVELDGTGYVPDTLISGNFLRNGANAFVSNVGIGTLTPESGLDIAATGTSSALIVPRDTTANRPGTGVNGMIRYNTNLNKLEAYENGAWTEMIVSAPSGTVSWPMVATPGTSSAGAPQYTFSGSLTTGMYTPSAGNLAFSASGFERLRITGDGDLGVGTTNPAYILDIRRDQNRNIALRIVNADTGTAAEAGIMLGNQNGDAGWLMTASDTFAPGSEYRNRLTLESSANVGGLNFIASGTGDMRFFTNNTTQERMRLTNDGRVGIGTTSPGSVALNVVGTGANNSAILIPRNTTALRPAGMNGMIRYNTNLNYFEAFEDGQWKQMIQTGTSGTAAWPLLANPGTTPPSAPSYSFDGDSNTGMFSPAAGRIAFATDGTTRLTIGSSSGNSQLSWGNSAISAATDGTMSIDSAGSGLYLQYALNPRMVITNDVVIAPMNEFVVYNNATVLMHGQGGRLLVGGGGSPGSAALEVVGTGANNSAILIPRNTTALRPAGMNGMIRYNTNLNYFEAFEDGQWKQMIQTGVSGTASWPLLANPGTSSAGAPSYSFTGDNNTGIFSPSADKVSIATAGTAAVTVDAAGRVGIGTLNPSAPLNIVGGDSLTTGGIQFGTGATGIHHDSNDFYFTIAGVQRYEFISNGLLFNTALSPSIWPSGPTQFQVRSGEETGIGAGSTGVLNLVTNGTARAFVSDRSFGIGAHDPVAALSVTATGTTSAILVPRDTTANRPAGNAANGMIRYNTNTNKFEAFENGGWTDMITTVSGTVSWPLTATPGTAAPSAPQYTFAGGANSGLYSPGTSTIAFSTAGNERMRIEPTGYIGIGMAPQNTMVTIAGGLRIDGFNSNTGAGNEYNAMLTFGSGSSEGIQSKRNAGGNQYGLDFVTGGIPRISVTGSGIVGIGTSAPGSAALDVVGTGANNSAILVPRNTTALRPAGANGMIRYNTNLNYFEAFEDGQWKQMIQTGTSGTAAWPLLANPATTSAGAPSYSFAGNPDTGLFSPATDKVAISASGTAYVLVEPSKIILNADYTPSNANSVTVLSTSTDYTNPVTYGLGVGDGDQDNRRVALGYDYTVESGLIQSIFIGSTYKPLALNPLGGNVGVGTIAPGSAALNVFGTTSTDSAIVVPRATTAARPGVAVNGMIRYNTNTNKFEFFQDGGWVNYGTGAGGSSTIDGLTDAISNSGLNSLYLGDGAGANYSTVYNVGIGIGTMHGTSADGGNTAVGSGVMRYTTGGWNTAIGAGAAESLTTGMQNTAVGLDALRSLTTGFLNTAVGIDAMRNVNGGQQMNTALGAYALKEDSGDYNVAVGAYAFQGGVGNYNVALGNMAGQTGGNISFSVLLGNQAARELSDGNWNIAIGYLAGDGLISGEGNILIGAGATTTSGTASNQINIGDTIFGDIETKSISIGEATGTDAALDVVGTTGYTSAILVPRATTAARPFNPVNGMIRYNTDLNYFEAYENGQWKQMIQSGTSGTAAWPLLANPGTTPPSAPSYSFASDTNTGMFSSAPGQIDFALDGTSKISLLNVGNLAMVDVTGYIQAIYSNSGGLADPLNVGNSAAATTDTGAAINFSGGGGNLGKFGMAWSGNSNQDAYTVIRSKTGGSETEKMRITHQGNVGIGTSSPASDAKLHIHGGAANYVFAAFSNNSTGTASNDGFYVGIENSNEGVIANNESAPIKFKTDGDNERMRVAADGNVGIGTTSPDYRLDVRDSFSATSGSPAVIYATASHAPSSASSMTSNAMTAYSSFSGTATSSSAHVQGIYALAEDSSGASVTLGNMSGVMAQASNSGAGTVTTMIGSENKAENSGSGTATSAYGTYSYVMRSGGAITNGYGVYVGSVQATNKWSLYASDSTAPSYFAGNVGIGTTSPGRLLHVNGPMRVTASALPGTPATGDIAVDSGDANKLKWYNGSGWQEAGGGSGGGRTSCPTGFSLVGTSGSTEAYCISTNEETSATWLNAVTNCANKTPAARLCSASEWVHACVKAGTYGISNMTGNWEWVADLLYDAGQVMGDAGCGSFFAYNSVSNSYGSRCCFR